jgi:hypothetical protein
MASLKWGLPNPPIPTASQTIAGGTYLKPTQPLVKGPGVIWTGASGIKYQFSIHAIGGTCPSEPGVYVATCLMNGIWVALYVGETEDLGNRLNNLRLHHRYASMCSYGATHLGLSIVTGGSAIRKAIETDLRRALNPPCNLQ